MKSIGSTLLAIGFLLGAFVAVSQPDRVDWMGYGACLALMVVGMLFHRVARQQSLADAGEKHDEDLGVLESSLASLTEKVRNLERDSSDEQQLEVHQRIDDELMEDIGNFVDARESMIPRLGMQTYADIMSPFAAGERQLNRAWSASADGYVDEVRTCVAEARRQLEQAGVLLAKARS